MQPACALSGRAAAPVRVSSPFAPHPVAGRVARAPLAPPAAVQNPLAALFQPKQAAPKTSATTAALVDEILELAASTKAGVKTPTAKADRIAELAAQLKATRGRAPTTRSPFFNGVYSVSYCSNPAAPGGPVLTSGLGRVVAAGQQPQQILEPVRWPDGDRKRKKKASALRLIPSTRPAPSSRLTHFTVHRSPPLPPTNTKKTGPPDQPGLLQSPGVPAQHRPAERPVGNHGPAHLPRHLSQV